MKAEYDFSTMKRRGHPLREKVARGEIVLMSPLDIPNRETKLAALPSANLNFKRACHSVKIQNRMTR